MCHRAKWSQRPYGLEQLVMMGKGIGRHKRYNGNIQASACFNGKWWNTTDTQKHDYILLLFFFRRNTKQFIQHFYCLHELFVYLNTRMWKNNTVPSNTAIIIFCVVLSGELNITFQDKLGSNYSIALEHNLG